MPKLEINNTRYEELKDNVLYKPATCSDSLCCFLKKDTAKTLQVPPSPELSLIETYSDGSIKPTEVKKGLISLEGVEERRACGYLKPAHSIEDGILRLQFRCSRYNQKRHPTCESYPEEADRCTYHGRKHIHDMDLGQRLFYLFLKENFPELEEFSCGIKRSFIEGEFLLIPVPLYQPTPELFTPFKKIKAYLEKTKT